MPYIPKTNWQYNDVLTEKDMNRIESGLIEGTQLLESHAADKSNPHDVTAEQLGAAKVSDLDAYVKADGTTNFTANPTIKKPTPALILDASRPQKSQLRWNANATTDLGVEVLVDGVVAGTFKSDQSLTIGKLNTTDERLQRYYERIDQASVDTNGFYKVCDWLREDGSLYLKTTLSNPDVNGYYQTDTWKYYNAAGTSVVKTETYAYTWNTRGIKLTEVRTS
ncbi:hypothetical protein EV586_102227 [Tumebacillus sp. BK434]|uniref:hypothetical protein n=1 Tax=Tumebacillus sp. BK434 TaxID=2512169 RepID=UPI0010536226|nr:hypothetical protein [Tumebacillus sp. BK434]TCP57783.1 hypothetical protein EV586_102227 [Tumebacillus sp. BK434]